MIVAAMMATALLGADLSDMPTASAADLQCMGLLAVAIDDPTASDALKQQYTGGMMYYLGRLEGRDPARNWMGGCWNIRTPPRSSRCVRTASGADRN